jgi:hypothetical protein
MDQGLKIDIETDRLYCQFIKLINKIRKQILLDKNIVDIIKDTEGQLIEFRDKFSSNIR